MFSHLPYVFLQYIFPENSIQISLKSAKSLLSKCFVCLQEESPSLFKTDSTGLAAKAIF